MLPDHFDKTVWPAEWAPQAAVMLTWPHRHGDWRFWLGEVDRTFAELALHISRRQALLVVCYDAAHQRHVRELLASAGAALERVRFYIAPSNDAWARDHGPITVYRHGAPVLLDFRFNGWGEKYAHDLDDCISPRLHAQGAFGTTPLESVDLILEGGSIESDGQGTLLTTRQCLLAARRNGLEQPVLEQKLRAALGVERFLWLSHGHLQGDDTDSHIDTLARFCDPQTIAYQACDDSADPHYAELRAMAAELAAFRTATGRPYRRVALPLPRARYAETGERLPASYANFLIVNGAVLMPTYDDPADGVALTRLQACFPTREVVGVPSLSLIRQYGSLHCVTMQLGGGVIIS